MWVVAAYRRTHSVRRLAWFEGWWPPAAAVCIRQMNRVNFAMACHDNSTINIIMVIIIRPHRSTTYVDAAYCYRPSRMLCRSLCWSVTLVSPTKTAESIEMLFRLRTLIWWVQGTIY